MVNASSSRRSARRSRSSRTRVGRQQLGLAGAGEIAELGVGAGQREGGVGTGVVGAGPFGEAKGDRRLGEEQGPGAGDEIGGVDRTVHIELPGGATYRVDRPVHGDEAGGEATAADRAQVPGRRGRQHRMGELHGGVSAAALHADEAPPLHLGEGLGRHHRRQDLEPQRLAEHQGGESIEGGVAEAAEVLVDEIGEPGRHVDVTAPHPHPADVDEAALLLAVAHDLGEVPGIAARLRPQQLHHGRADLAVEALSQERGRPGRVERPDVDRLEQPVLPQRGHGVGRRLTAADGRHHRSRAARHEAEHGGRRVLVEQVGVVDDEHGRARPAALAQPAGDGAQHEGGMQRRQVLGEQARQRPERHRPAGAGGHDPVHVAAARRQRVGGVPDERRLPHPGVAEDHRTATVERCGELEQRVLPGDQRRAHPQILAAPCHRCRGFPVNEPGRRPVA